jgi:hypothetical protein
VNIDDIQSTSHLRYYSDIAAVDSAERLLGVRFPQDYRDFISRFGEGLLGGYIRVYPPYQIVEGDNSVTEWRKRIDEYWFWDEGKEILSKEKALECIIIADTMEGDELVAHSSEPSRLYVLPRHEETIYVAGESLMSAIGWLMTSGVLTDPIEDRSFEPFDGRSSKA